MFSLLRRRRKKGQSAAARVSSAVARPGTGGRARCQGKAREKNPEAKFLKYRVGIMGIINKD